jgi:hypothetical protein
LLLPREAVAQTPEIGEVGWRRSQPKEGVVRTDSKKISGGTSDSLSVAGDDGGRAVGGGGGVTGFSDAGDGVLIDRPLVNGNLPNTGETPNGWTVFAYNAGGGEDNLKTYVVCASR